MKKVKIVVNQNDCERVRKYAYCAVKKAIENIKSKAEVVRDERMVDVNTIECILNKVIEDIKNFEG
jgi:hypothetical protein